MVQTWELGIVPTCRRLPRQNYRPYPFLVVPSTTKTNLGVTRGPTDCHSLRQGCDDLPFDWTKRREGFRQTRGRRLSD